MTSIVQHSPGPWVLKHDRRGAGKLYIRCARPGPAGATAGLAVAQVVGAVGPDEQFANALLMTASTELLAAARQVVKRHDARAAELEPGFTCGCPDCVALLAAIAKSEGR